MAELSKSYKRHSGEGMDEPENQEFVFHTLFEEEFRGSSAEEVVDSLYHGSRAGMGNLNYDAWWEYQSRTWKQRYGLSVLDRGEPNACEKLLAIMVKVGALEVGPLPRQEKLKTDKRPPDV